MSFLDAKVPAPKAVAMCKLVSAKYVFRLLNDPTTYTCGDYHIYGGFNITRKNFEWVGKPESDTSYCVSFLKQPDPVVEMLTQTMEGYYNSDELVPLLFDMGVVGVARVYKQLQEPELKLTTDKKKLNLLIGTETGDAILGRVQNPMKICWLAIERYREMTAFLSDFITNGRSDDMTLVNITDLIYDRAFNHKGGSYKIKPVIMKSNHIVLDGVPVAGHDKGIKVKLILGLDTPSKPTFNSLGATIKSVQLFTQRVANANEGVVSFRVGTIVETEDGYSVTCAFPSNLRMVRAKKKKAV